MLVVVVLARSSTAVDNLTTLLFQILSRSAEASRARSSEEDSRIAILHTLQHSSEPATVILAALATRL